MSIDFLFELEQAVERGKSIYACPALVPGRWEFNSTLDTIRKVAKRVAGSKRTSVHIMRLTSVASLLPDMSLLIATKLGDGNGVNGSSITWTTVDTKDAAETLRDVSQGPSPYFGLEIEETIEPA